MVQTSKIKMEKDKITLMALTLTVTTKVKTITMFFLENLLIYHLKIFLIFLNLVKC